jgi:hypothetical protein
MLNFVKSRTAGKKLVFTILLFFPLLAIYSQDTIHVPYDYTTIQAAIDASNNGDIVLVAEGTYYENVNFNGKAITVASHFLINGDIEHIDNTIIDANDSGSVVIFNSGEDTTSILCGFTITGGQARRGGGIHCDSSGAKIIFNKIINNVANAFSATGEGGGIYADSHEYFNYIIIENNIIRNNSVFGHVSIGAGIGLFDMEGKIINNIIEQNHSQGGAGSGGMSLNGCSLQIINNTIIFNTASNSPGNDAGGIASFQDESIIINNIVWGNIGDEQIISDEILDIFYCDVEGGYTGVGNIDAYPEFVDTSNRDYHLSNSSPCIGSGIDSLGIGGMWYYCPVTDLEGNPRPNPLGSMPDMGVYESEYPVRVENYLSQVPKTYTLEHNFPNPFNPSTKIRYSIPQTSYVVIKVFDVLGNEIETLMNENKPAGSYEIEFNSHSGFVRNLACGIYFYQLQAVDPESSSGQVFVETRKMLLIK